MTTDPHARVKAVAQRVAGEQRAKPNGRPETNYDVESAQDAQDVGNAVHQHYERQHDDRHEVLYPPPYAPFAVAEQLYADYRTDADMRTLVAWRGGWMFWCTTHWAEIDTAELRSHIYETLHKVVYEHVTKDGTELKPWNPDKRKVANVLEAMAAIGYLSTDIDSPAWIDTHSAAETAATQIISCKNGLLDVSSRNSHDHTPALFNIVSVPFNYQHDVQPPSEWLTFLNSLWPGDPDSILLLQEYFGYVLSGRLDMQKLLLLIGPTRSGKGTIARILTALVGGRSNVPGPTLASLSTNFGLSPLLGRSLAIISDARLGNIPSHTVVERLLSITGEDTLTIDRKYREAWTGKLPTRFVILTNELPKFKDSSGAIANRLLILRMTESFLGREDHELYNKLRPELTGILKWSLDGLDRLTKTGSFTIPKSAHDAAKLMMDMASPVSTFVRDCLERTPGAFVPKDRVYEAWRTWAERSGHHPGAKASFGRDLRAVVPEVTDSQRTINSLRTHCYDGIGFKTAD